MYETGQSVTVWFSAKSDGIVTTERDPPDFDVDPVQIFFPLG